jgi:hypothetical protein
MTVFDFLSSFALAVFCFRQFLQVRRLKARVRGLEMIHGWNGDKRQAYVTVKMRDAHNLPL